MKVTLEQIDELRNRVNVTYEEAKRTLEKNDGDLIKSIIELEKKKGQKKDKGNVTGFVDKLLQLKLSIRNKQGNTLLNVPLVVVLIIFIMAFWVVIFGIILALITSCKIRVYRDKNSMDVNSIKKNMHDTVDKIKDKSEEIIKDDASDDNKDDKNDTDEHEIIIE